MNFKKESVILGHSFLDKERKEEGKIMANHTQSAIAYQQISDMIFHMELMPGTRISELQLSSKLEISRTPIHDALLRLSSEGLVKMEDKKSAVVRCFDDDEIREIGTLRLSQDILSAQLASYYGSASDFDRLRQMALVCEEAAAKGDIYKRITADSDFHLEIARISGNSFLLNQQASLYRQIHLIQICKYTDIESSLLQIHHHEPLISAISMGDLAEVTRLICSHISGFYCLDSYVLRCFGFSQDQTN